MKSIALLLILAAAGCKKDPPPPDCAGSINQGMDKFAAKVNAPGTAPQLKELLNNVVTKLRGVLTTHCTTDQWTADKLPCFAAASNQREIHACEEALTPDQRTKLRTEIQQVMMGMRSGAAGMPAGHPQFLAGRTATGSGSDAAGSAGSAAPAATGSAAPAATGSAAPKAAGSSAAPAAGGW